MSKAISPAKRGLVFRKTGGRCAYCGTHLDPFIFSVDHVHPRKHGGCNSICNLLPSCSSCNSSKGTKDIESFRLFFAAKAVTRATVFSVKQAQYLKDAGVFGALGFDENHKFYFELASDEAI